MSKRYHVAESEFSKLIIDSNGHISLCVRPFQRNTQMHSLENK